MRSATQSPLVLAHNLMLLLLCRIVFSTEPFSDVWIGCAGRVVMGGDNGWGKHGFLLEFTPDGIRGGNDIGG